MSKFDDLEPSPYTTAVQQLLSLRWAEALLSAREAEDIIAEYASQEAQLAALRDREERVSI